MIRRFKRWFYGKRLAADKAQRLSRNRNYSKKRQAAKLGWQRRLAR